MTMTDIKTLQSAADQLWKAQMKVRAAEAKLRPLKEAAAALEDALQGQMIEAKLEALSTKHVTLALKRTIFAQLTDDKAFFAYVGKHKAWDLVRKQPVIAACRARWDDDLTIPGVESATRVDLSITARK
jgi:ribosomal protein S12